MRKLCLALALALVSAHVGAHVATAGPVDRIEALEKEMRKHQMKSSFHAALRVARKVYRLKRRHHGPADPTTLMSLQMVASMSQSVGDYFGAIRAAKDLVALTERARGPKSIELARALDQLAAIYWVRQDFQVADRLYRRSLAIKKEQHGEKSDRYATALQIHGSYLSARHSYSEAKRVLERALDIGRELHGDDSPRLNNPLMTLAFVYYGAGEKKKAIRALERVVKLSEKAYGGDDTITLPTMLSSIASLYQQWGEDRRADKLLAKLEKSFQSELAAKKKEGNESMVRYALQNLASLYQRQKRWKEALSAWKKVAAIDQKMHGKDSMASTASLYPIADIHRKQGDLGRAVRIYRRLAKIHEKHYSGWMSTTPSNVLAEVYREMGSYRAARRELTKVLKAAIGTMGKGHPFAAMARERLGVIYMAAGKGKQAARTLDRALEVQDRHLNVVLSAGTESDNRAYFSKRAYQLDLAITAHARYAGKDPQAARMAVRAILVRKGRLLDAAAGSIASLRRRMSKKDRLLLDRLSAARSQLAKLVIKGPKSADKEAYKKEVARLEKEISGLEVKVRRRSAEFRAQDQPIELKRVRRAIPKDAVLVEIASYRVFDPKARAGQSFSGKRRFIAYVLRRRGPIEWVDLGPAAQLERRVERLRLELSRPGGDYKKPAQKLYRATIQKLEKSFGGADQVLLAPDGALNLVPFAALVDNSGRHLVRKYAFSYLTSGRDLLRFKVSVKAKQKSTILADPDFEEAAHGKKSAPADGRRGRRSRDLSKVNWPRLPGTAEEAKAIAAELKKDVVVLRGEKATEGALKMARGPRILHLATHGFFLPPDAEDPPLEPQANRSQTTPPGNVGAASPAPPSGPENPLLRSGLTFAGANRLESGSEDGILTALEAAGLDLWGTRLVVLSACETAVGKVTTGDGVHGLRRALVIAGAESLVMSLWQVDDKATRDLMTGYYRRLSAGKGRAEALRQIQLKMLTDDRYRHPYYWASFIPAGDWAPLE